MDLIELIFKKTRVVLTMLGLSVKAIHRNISGIKYFCCSL